MFELFNELLPDLDFEVINQPLVLHGLEQPLFVSLLFGQFLHTSKLYPNDLILNYGSLEDLNAAFLEGHDDEVLKLAVGDLAVLVCVRHLHL
jgi:hypothetical protein